MPRIFCTLFLGWAAAIFVQASPLHEYVLKPDKHYTWELVDREVIADATIYHLELTSQAWRSKDEVSDPVWKHHLEIILPNKLTGQHALLFIQNNRKSCADPLINVAIRTHAMVAKLYTVPNQNIKFVDETDVRYKESGRKEDAIIAYTWKKFLDTNDSEWPLGLPMAKSVVKTMDCIEEFCDFINVKKPKGFVLSGFSKRGWTAWMVAAVDSRVSALVPVVIDLVNLKQSFVRHYNAYGSFSPAVQDYLDMGITDSRNHPLFDNLLAFTDPYNFLASYTMPKYIINSTGDQFFLPDSSQFYFSQLPKERYLRYIPNADHALAGTDVFSNIETFFHLFVNSSTIPQLEWDYSPNGVLTAQSSMQPKEVIVWVAENPLARDFRLTTIGAAWKKIVLPVRQLDSGYIATTCITPPEEGWRAFFIEYIFDTPTEEPFKLTTNVYITPDTFIHNLEE